MFRVKLVTRDGGLVARFAVNMPYPRGLEPEIAYWGSRIFVHGEGEMVEFGSDGVPELTYKEGIALMLPELATHSTALIRKLE